jgi:tetratricopeptide (TPR) repeat protein
MATGVAYCRTISACLDLWDFRRALEWTHEVDKREQGGEAGFPGDCMTHRVAIRIVHGEWAEAEREAEVACVTGDLFDRNHVGAAIYEIGEIKLRMGDLDAAEDAFRRANELANPCQPGMALLMLARGDLSAASASIGAAVASVPNDALVRARLLPAQVAIALAVGDVEAAALSATDLDGIGERFGTAAMRAAAASARGSVELERGRPAQAVTQLRSGVQLWTEVGAPYESALARVGLGQALAALDDRGGAAMELRAAATAFERLGAEPDLERTNALLRHIR